MRRKDHVVILDVLAFVNMAMCIAQSMSQRMELTHAEAIPLSGGTMASGVLHVKGISG